MKIIVDGMGGDKGPVEVVKGCVDAIKEFSISIGIVGQEDIINKELDKYTFDKDRIEVIHASDTITNDDEPALSIRRKKDSSMVVGLKELNNQKGDGFISAGNTGALLAGGLFIIKRIEGIDRAAITTVYPTANGVSLLLDAGANMDTKPEYLQQFAIMASIYFEKVFKKERPSVGLINVGTEESKGNELTKKTYELLKSTNINFYGNIEGRDISKGVTDIILCDGFVGNIILKLTEGLAFSLFDIIKKEVTSSFTGKVGGLLLKPNFKSIKEMMDYREYGGAPLLGTRKPVFKAHGSSDALAIKNGIGQLKTFIEMNVIENIEKNLENN